MVSRGQIAPISLSLEMKKRQKNLQQFTELRCSSENPRISSQTESNKFYANLDDLRYKLQIGLIQRSYAPKQKPAMLERIFPAFISPKVFEKATKDASARNSRNKHNSFAPPLLPLDSQNPPNHFFAGQQFHYDIPTPLPENPRYLSAIASKKSSAMGSKRSSAARKPSRLSSSSSSSFGIGSRECSVLTFNLSGRGGQRREVKRPSLAGD